MDETSYDKGRESAMGETSKASEWALHNSTESAMPDAFPEIPGRVITIADQTETDLK